MHHELLKLPGGLSIKTYGFMLMIGFASATWMARRCARRVKADPDVVLNVGVLAMLFGIAGARLFYVIHYWRRFADGPNPLAAILDIRKGGLEFLGGFIFATIAIVAYLMFPRRCSDGIRRPLSIRMYVDIFAPSVVLGLAFTRLGCFGNGCCFGDVCVSADRQEAVWPWAVEFPYGSPSFNRQWEERAITVPAELIRTSKRYPHPKLVDRDVLISSDRDQLVRVTVARQHFPSRQVPSRPTSASELRAFASNLHALYAHPTQVYSSISCALLTGVLAWMFRVRKRHGVVLAYMLVCYPISRFLLEMIRSDNPRDTFGMTASQFVSVVMFSCGIVLFIVLYRFLPLRSPHAVAWVANPPMPIPQQPQRKRKRRKR